jgi:hypothetical protein
MTSNSDNRNHDSAAPPPDQAIDPVMIEVVRRNLAAIDRTMFGSPGAISLDRQLGDIRRAVGRPSEPVVAEPIGIDAATPSGLAALAEQALFERHYDAVATVIAARFSLKVHYALAGLRAAFAAWIARSAARPRAPDHRHFIAVIALLVECLVRERIVTYSVMVRPPGARDRLLDTIVKFPNEVTGLLAGAGLYSMMVARLTNETPDVPLSAIVLANAASIVRRRPEAATRFRELLQLGTPWA